MENKICTKINLKQTSRAINSYSVDKIAEWTHAKDKNNTNVNIQKHVESKIVIQIQIQTSN